MAKVFMDRQTQKSKPFLLIKNYNSVVHLQAFGGSKKLRMVLDFVHLGIFNK